MTQTKRERKEKTQMMDAVPEPIMGNRMLGKHVSLRGLGDLGKEKPKQRKKKGPSQSGAA